uniref:Uncharacterized protein n=2 Tax=Ochrobactrum sp. LM19 TaxID=1449781 RepID=A0A0D5A0T3_9HYPH|nr:hypothetical protein pLM19O2_p74 [Ochrobactrum sp. LM19]
MYLARFEQRILIKRMPDSGCDHDPECEHFEAPASLSGLGDVLGKAIEEKEDGSSVLKLGFSLSRTGAHLAPTPGGDPSDTVSAQPDKLSLRSLLHYLWHEAGLHRWTPAFEGKRHWRQVHARLTAAGAAMITKKAPLSDRLYIPEPFRTDQASGIEARRRAFMARFRPDRTDRRDLVLIVGELKAIDPSRYGYRLTLKHMADFPLYASADTVKRLNKRFVAEFEIAASIEDVHLMIIATASINHAGHASLEDASVMLVDENWIPFEDIDERDLIAELSRTGRSFVKGLRFNVQNRPLANLLLTDLSPAVAMYILPATLSDENRAVIDEMTNDSRISHWIWETGNGPWPAIPGRNNQLRIGRPD